MRLYDFWESGNCYKVRLWLALQDVPFERVSMDILRGDTRTPEVLAKNPNGRVPLLEWPDGRCLAESGAILWHLAEGSALLPADPWEHALVLQWMFFEQYSHEPNVAVARFWHFAGLVDDNRAALPEKLAKGYAWLRVMENQLATTPYIVAERYTIADIALYAYTDVADEGGFDLSAYPAIGAWIERVAAQPGHVRITDAVGQPAPPS